MSISRIGIYIDKDLNIIINPVLQDAKGVPRSSRKFIRVEKGWSNSELSQSIMKAFKISEDNVQENYVNSKFWIEATGIKGFAAFSKKYRYISINYIQEKNTYTVTAQKRYKDGSYGYDQEDIPLRVKEYAGRPSVEAIAEQVLEALKIE